MDSKSRPKTAAVIVSAGKGIRFGSEDKKQFINICGNPVITWVLESFDLAENISRITLVVPPEDIEFVKKKIIENCRFTKPAAIVEGGLHRQDSVFNGLASLPSDVEFAAIHDGVRPAVTPGHINEICSVAFRTGAAVAAMPATDSIFINKENKIDSYAVRSVLWQAQTPQVFRLDKILEAHKKARENSFEASDDGMIYRKYAGEVSVVKGESTNIKLTYKQDIILLEEILRNRKAES